MLVLASRLEHAGAVGSADEQDAEAVEISLDFVLAHVTLDLVDGSNLGQLILRQSAGPHGAIPGYRPRADVVL